MTDKELQKKIEGTTQTFAEAKEIVTAFEAKSRTQAKANNNSSNIQNLFVRDPEGNIYYPSEYCGSWIDGEDLCVALTDTSEKVVEKYRSVVDYKDNIKFEKMQSSLNTLNSQANEYASYLESKNIVCSVFVNEEKNKCVIEVIDDTEANVLNVLKSEISKIDPDSKFSDSSVIIQKGGYVTPQMEIIGGMKGTTSKSGFTIGMCGRISMSSGTFYDGVISCGHGKELGDSVSIEGKTFGTVCVNRYYNNAVGDFSCIRMTSDDTLTHFVYGWNGLLRVSSFYLNGALNSEVLKYGQKSGFASANIVAYNVPVVSEDGITIKGVTKCIITSGKSTKGDSGGPYVVIRDDGSGNFSFIGIHQGAPSNPTSDMYVYFTPCEQFINYFVPQTWL